LKTVTVVGASLAGLYAARALRAEGFDGRLVVVGAEPHRPYDRPPLSKDVLTGKAEPGQLALSDDEEERELAAEWLLGSPAVSLAPGGRAVALADGREVRTDGLVIATGAAARPLPGSRLAGVHTLRTLDDAQALRAELTAGQPRVAVIGGGFIGAETASSCAALRLETTVIEAAPLPLVPALGEELARECAALHEAHGVTLITGTGVAALRADGGSTGEGGRVSRVAGVELADGRFVPAEVVVVGIGAKPVTGWLESSGLALDNGVVCDTGCVTALPNVVAVGDVARVGGIRSEHWTAAIEQPAVAVRNLLAGRTVEEYRSVPYFWSDQYGMRIQYAGRRPAGTVARITEGSTAERSFLAVYEHDGVTVGAFSMNRPRPFMRLRKGLAPR
jgi:NADPH-dependent 2,4-dienoyl-CoA reductase/sulfur reductase-like enzyme